MSEERRFSRESLTYVFGEALSKSLAFVLLPIYTAYLSLEEFAILNFVSSLWPVVVVFLGQGFATYVIRGYYEYDDKRRFFGTVLFFSMAVALVLASLIHIFGPWLCELIFKELTYRPYLQYAVFFAVFRLYFNHVVSYYRARRLPRTSVALSLVLFSTNLVAVLAAIFAFDGGLAGILRAQLIAYGVVALLYTYKVWPEVSPRWQGAVLGPAVLFVLPLIPHALSGWLVNHVGKVFIETHFSLAQLSVYSVAVQLALILSVVNAGLNQAWVPFVYANYAGEDSQRLLRVSAQRTILLVMLLGTILVVFGRELLALMGKAAYLEALFVLPILVLGYVFQIVYFIYVAVILYHKRSEWLPVVSIASGLLAILLNMALVPVLGLFGSALSTTLAFLLMAALAYGFARRLRRLPVLTRRMLLFLLLAGSASAASLLAAHRVPLLAHALLNLGLVGLLVAALLRLGLMNLQNLRALLRDIHPFTFS